MTSTVTRRDLIKGTLAGGLVGQAGVRSLLFGTAEAATLASAGNDARTLVVVFLRGGADALSLVAPADDPDYLAARAPELRVATDGPKAGHRLDQQLAPSIDFRLHPEAAPLAELYAGRELAIVHAAGLSDGTRSHFVAQDLMEHGIAHERDLARTADGWVARSLADAGTWRDGPAAIGTSAMPPAALHGSPGTLAIPDLRQGLVLPGGSEASLVLAALHAGDGAYERAARSAMNGLAAIDGRLARGPDGKVAAYPAEGGAVYEETEAGRALQTVARVLKMDQGLRVACVDVGGWDTHDRQAGRFATAIGQLSRALAAFHADTARYRQTLRVVVMSEFGRRLRSNRSQGTDHGHGGVMLVLGGGVAGGRMYGRWPGLASHQLDRGVDLAVTTDYRTVLAELIDPAAAARAFPGLPNVPPLGILGGAPG